MQGNGNPETLAWSSLFVKGIHQMSEANWLTTVLLLLPDERIICWSLSQRGYQSQKWGQTHTLLLAPVQSNWSVWQPWMTRVSIIPGITGWLRVHVSIIDIFLLVTGNSRRSSFQEEKFNFFFMATDGQWSKIKSVTVKGSGSRRDFTNLVTKVRFL